MIYFWEGFFLIINSKSKDMKILNYFDRISKIDKVNLFLIGCIILKYILIWIYITFTNYELIYAIIIIIIVGIPSAALLFYAVFLPLIFLIKDKDYVGIFKWIAKFGSIASVIYWITHGQYS